jgi:formate/nitrite transporter FocA (FNT family)
MSEKQSKRRTLQENARTDALEEPDESEGDDEGYGLLKGEQQEIERRTAPRAVVLHEAIRAEGELELERPYGALFWSGLAAGLSMGFSLVGQGLLAEDLPGKQWEPLVASFGYTLGFVVVVLGRQQLFTENTLTPVLSLLHKRDARTLRRVAALWAIVLVSNVIGGAIFALIAAKSGVFDAGQHQAFEALALHAVEPGPGTLLVKAVFAGWLIALMVWLLPFSESNRLHTVILMTYFVALGSFSHIIAGSIEVMYGAWRGVIAWHEFALDYFWPVLLGNIFGGLALVTALNHGQVASGTDSGSV